MSKDAEKTEPNVVGLLLAAGMSRRAGDVNKLLYKHVGKPLVQHVAQAMTDSCVNSVLVVLGHEAQAVEKAIIQTAVAVSVNMDYERGLASSLVHGVSLLYDADAVVVCLGDMPHVSSAVINLLIEAMHEHPDKSVFIPVCQGQRGNPVLITKERFEDILKLSGDQGARLLTQQQPETVFEVSTDMDGVLLDYDTIEELNKLSGLSLGLNSSGLIPMP